MKEQLQENATQWTPSQANYLDFLASGQITEDGIKQAKEEYAKKLKVNPSTLWRWEQLPGFWEEVSRRTPKLIHKHIPEMTNAMITKALSGDVNAYKVLLNQAGRLKEEEHPEEPIKGFADLLKAARQAKGQ